ncbi:MAG TPA: serine/threonine-protein kinase, partial [Pyrinomonadaceae bacterium]|nr:serine/threonine-protein kinase [Pyrinomonadaceae bacterium]
MTQTSNDFLGTERFKIRRRLGSAGMGVVYEAHDREMDKVVALKALTGTEASHISRFKNEFRSLADVSHPNLVSLYEFMADGQYWFFTMELVHGVNFLEYVRPGFRSKRSQSSITPTLIKSESQSEDEAAVYEAQTRQLDLPETASLANVSPETSIDRAMIKSKLDIERLTHAIRQLAEGLQALHQTGKLHRDIKPSNVLVSKEGRVVILDFGLVAQLEGTALHDSVNLAGTPDYMSPEQGAQLPISAASDWYSVGVMLYQALTGRLPFSGKFFEVMVNKQTRDAPPPNQLVPQVPGGLNDLCVSLLRRNPKERPLGAEVLAILGQGTSGPLKVASTASPASFEVSSFVGRQRHVKELIDSFETTRRGLTVTVYVHGISGMGKSSLVQHFIDVLKS